MMVTLKRITKRTGTVASDPQGLGLVETLVAVAILGTSVVAFVVALSAGTIAVGEQDEAAVATGLLQSQLEYTKSYAYDAGASTYPALTAPPDYAIYVGVSSVPGTDENIQKITVTILRDGRNVTAVADYKVNR
jgi:type II secretory pathway pseudopilin PulG